MQSSSSFYQKSAAAVPCASDPNDDFERVRSAASYSRARSADRRRAWPTWAQQPLAATAALNGAPELLAAGAARQDSAELRDNVDPFAVRVPGVFAPVHMGPSSPKRLDDAPTFVARSHGAPSSLSSFKTNGHFSGPASPVANFRYPTPTPTVSAETCSIAAWQRWQPVGSGSKPLRAAPAPPTLESQRGDASPLVPFGQDTAALAVSASRGLSVMTSSSGYASPLVASAVFGRSFNSTGDGAKAAARPSLPPQSGSHDPVTWQQHGAVGAAATKLPPPASVSSARGIPMIERMEPRAVQEPRQVEKRVPLPQPTSVSRSPPGRARSASTGTLPPEPSADVPKAKKDGGHLVASRSPSPARDTSVASPPAPALYSALHQQQPVNPPQHALHQQVHSSSYSLRSAHHSVQSASSPNQGSPLRSASASITTRQQQRREPPPPPLLAVSCGLPLWAVAQRQALVQRDRRALRFDAMSHLLAAEEDAAGLIDDV